jgi:predicted DCC family thiol-disulfide oxidoreductase YuxK
MELKMKIVFFDGYCSLCNNFVDWLMQIDSRKQLKFASLQGETAAQLGVRSDKRLDLDTLVYVRGDQKFERSTAVLLILSDVGGIWSLSRAFLIVPQSLRDFVYKFIARNRYRIWKKRQTCRIPTVEEQGRFLL